MSSSFFDEYHPYLRHVVSGRFPEAVNSGISLLSGVKQLSSDKYEDAHKGTPFYVMGFAAFASHDYETASFLFDAAVSEDLKNYPGRTNTPALWFIQLDDGNADQLARDVVKHVKVKATELIQHYNGREGAQTLTFNDVRNRFLKRILTGGQLHTRALITTFISFIAEWHHRTLLINLTNHGSREPFFMHLFRGCLLFESLLKENPSKGLQHETLGKILNQDLATELAIRQVDVREQDFNAMVGALVPNMSVEDSIESTGKARNTLGHNIVWMTTGLTPQTYDLLVRNIAVACIHAISKLYP
jgi:hypothetical protein